MKQLSYINARKSRRGMGNAVLLNVRDLDREPISSFANSGLQACEALSGKA